MRGGSGHIGSVRSGLGCSDGVYLVGVFRSILFLQEIDGFLKGVYLSAEGSFSSPRSHEVQVVHDEELCLRKGKEISLVSVIESEKRKVI
jgi:hypothetical protein